MRYFTVLFCTKSLKSGVYTCSTFRFEPATHQVLNGHKCLVASVADSMAVDCKLSSEDWYSSWSLLYTTVLGI